MRAAVRRRHVRSVSVWSQVRTITRRRVGFFTDVEGQLDFFRRAVEFSSIVCFDSEGGLDFRQPGGTDEFCFGGDSVDHGPGDMRITCSLVEFKCKYPDRVHLLAGNRDINKMRLTSELVPIWETSRHEASTLAKHILAKTMGAPNAFEFRRQELLEITGENANDEAVTRSFVESVLPNGFMSEYLFHAQLGACISDTLFVHGAIPACGLNFLPSGCREEGDFLTPETSVQEWIRLLNKFYRLQIAQWLADAATGRRESATAKATDGNRAGFSLMQYVNPGNILQANGVVYNDWLRKGETSPASLPASVYAALSKAGIRRVICGHRPHGGMPLVIRGGQQDEGEVFIVTADTSYSDKQAADNRGVAVSEIVVDIPEGKTHVRGVRANDFKYDFCVEEEPLIGQRFGDTGGWVKCTRHRKDGEEVLLAFSKGPGTFSSDLAYSWKRVFNE